MRNEETTTVLDVLMNAENKTKKKRKKQRMKNKTCLNCGIGFRGISRQKFHSKSCKSNYYHNNGLPKEQKRKKVVEKTYAQKKQEALRKVGRPIVLKQEKKNDLVTFVAIMTQQEADVMKIFVKTMNPNIKVITQEL